eukprot:3894854-Pleurochrysis_carterae.AAC.1
MTGWAAAAVPALAQTRRRALRSIGGSGRRRPRALLKPTRASQRSAPPSRRPTRMTTRHSGW